MDIDKKLSSHPQKCIWDQINYGATDIFLQSGLENLIYTKKITSLCLLNECVLALSHINIKK